MKNSKGFTLIELLAVIVILAIIALVATPIILNVIDTARKGAKESSTLGYIDAVEKQVMMSQVDSSASLIPAGTYTVEQLSNLKVDIKGEKPDGTSVVVINNKGAVAEGWFTYSGTNYKIYYNGSKAVASTGDDYIDENGTTHNTIPEPGSTGNNTEEQEEPITGPAPTIDSCPGCVYIYTTGSYSAGGGVTNNFNEDYRYVIRASKKNYFIGVKLNQAKTKVEETYICGILNKGESNEKSFCVRGMENENHEEECSEVYNTNKSILNGIYGSYDSSTKKGCKDDSDSITCYGSINTSVDAACMADIYENGNNDEQCLVDYQGGTYCEEE